MTTRPDSPSLQALAESLAATFPGSDDAPLALALLRELSQGQPVSAAALSTSTGRDESDMTATLSRWPNVRSFCCHVRFLAGPLFVRCFNRHERDAAPDRGQMLAGASGVKMS